MSEQNRGNPGSVVDRTGRIPNRPAGPLQATVENVLPFYLQKTSAGQRVCLVTQFRVDTVAPRPIGSQIAVAEDGESFGFITGGCAESAIVHEALMAMKENRSRTLRIGSDSPWFDIKLPCGAGIELHFCVSDSATTIASACQSLADRIPVSLAIDTAADRIALHVGDTDPSHNRDSLPETTFVRNYDPQTRLAVIGSGPYLDAISSLATASDFDLLVWSPELSDDPVRRRLPRTSSLPFYQFDRWTAAVLLFHEHDREPKLLKAILESDCFYIGALGSRKTHVSRLQTLRAYGVSERQLHRIKGPAGLSIHARTPAEIAISILAEIIRVRNADDFHRGSEGAAAP